MADPTPSPARRFNARLGIVLFFVYLLIYGLFVGLSAFRLDLMSKPFIGGVNLAVVYGFALIVGALVLALLYMALCKPEQEDAQ